MLHNITQAWPGLTVLNPQLSGLSPEHIARRFYANLGCFLIEVVRVHFGLGETLLNDVEFRGIEYYREAKDAGKGVIFVTAHCGNWEASALAFGRQYEPMSIVVRQQQSKEITDLLEKLRARYGNETIMKDGAARKVLSVIRQGGVVGILSDIAVKKAEGILTPFLGKPAWTTPMPAVIAQKTGCMLLPGFIHRENERLVVQFHPSIECKGKDVATITADLSHVIERQIATYPDEWFWFYNRWRRAPETMPVEAEP